MEWVEESVWCDLKLKNVSNNKKECLQDCGETRYVIWTRDSVNDNKKTRGRGDRIEDAEIFIVNSNDGQDKKWDSTNGTVP